jgi:hypothetical protein
VTDPRLLAERGYALLPLAPRSKTPHMTLLCDLYGSAKWGPLAENPATPQQVESWIDHDPECGFGLITGQPSGLAVLDVDDPAGMPRQRFSPAPPMVSTSRGVHLYFRADGPVQTRRLSWGEIKGEGSYVVIPPSLHPDGPRYLWCASLLDHDPPPLPSLLADNNGECSSTVSVVAGRTDRDTVLKYSPSLNLDEVLSSDVFILHVAAFLDLPIVTPTDKFTCPFHPDETVPSANFFRGRSGGYLLRCWHSPVTARLGDFYHFRITGSEKRLRNSSSATWLCRLLLDSGFIKPPPVNAAPLSTNDGHVQVFYRGCILLHQCRLLYDSSNKTFPATPSFMSEWCSISESESLNALRWLIRHDFLVVVERGQVQANGRRPATLYSVGDNGGDQ